MSFLSKRMPGTHGRSQKRKRIQHHNVLAGLSCESIHYNRSNSKGHIQSYIFSLLHVFSIIIESAVAIEHEMPKRRKNCRKLSTPVSKRAKISLESNGHTPSEPEDIKRDHSDSQACGSTSIRVEHEDRVETKVDIIVRDTLNNSYRSLTIWGTGLGVEKTIAVVEELKRSYHEQGTQFTQETSIKTSDNDEPHLQVVLNLHPSHNEIADQNQQLNLRSCNNA